MERHNGRTPSPTKPPKARSPPRPRRPAEQPRETPPLEPDDPPDSPDETAPGAPGEVPQPPGEGARDTSGRGLKAHLPPGMPNRSDDDRISRSGVPGMVENQIRARRCA